MLGLTQTHFSEVRLHPTGGIQQITLTHHLNVAFTFTEAD